VMADVAKLPVLDIVSAVHFTADLTLGRGEVVHDYLADHSRSAAGAKALEKAGA
ncbi:MAG: acetoacetate decarboxylase, partial [Mesorhizobium sp.]